MATLFVLAVLFSVLAVVAAGVTPIALRSDRRFARGGAVTTGVVLAIESDYEHGDNARIEFASPLGRHVFHARATRRGPRVGETVRVRYSPHRPEEAAIDAGAHVYRRTIMGASLSIGFAIAAAVMFALHLWLTSAQNDLRFEIRRFEMTMRWI